MKTHNTAILTTIRQESEHQTFSDNITDIDSIEQQWAKLSLNTNDNTTTTPSSKNNLKKLQKKKSQVLLEGYVDDDTMPPRAKSLTDEDLDELKGCVDLGFGFSYDEIPELCSTLPALELCYSMSQKFIDEHHQKNGGSSSGDSASEISSSDSSSATASPIANWKISSPGDHPEDVKARLKFWAQAVACTVKLCS